MRVILLLVLCGLLAGCDPVFEPYLESEYYFTLNGYLDSSSDTQFVRVVPLRQTVTPDRSPIDADVTLEHVGSGRTWAWRDSLFVFTGNQEGHNFYSTADLTPGETYRFTVVRSDGATSTAVVSLPDSFPEPVVFPGFPNEPSLIRVEGVERLVDAVVTYTYRVETTGEIHAYTRSYRDFIDPASFGATVSVYDLTDRSDIMDRHRSVIEILEKRATVVAAGDDWPDLRGVDSETAALPEAYSNVENGFGYLGGVTTRSVTWR